MKKIKKQFVKNKTNFKSKRECICNPKITLKYYKGGKNG